MSRSRYRLLWLFLPALCLVGCEKPKPIERTQFIVNTVVSVQIFDSRDETLLDDAFALCAELEGQLSRTIPTSDIARLNAAEGEWVRVSEAARDCIRAGIHFGELSGGLFDITIKPLSEQWDFASALLSPESVRLPDADALAEAAKRVDYRQIEIDGERVRLRRGGEIDLGGIAKGYIADRVASLLKARGVRSALVDLGGNVYAVGEKPDRSAWKIGVQIPFRPRGEMGYIVQVRDCSVVTSGIVEKTFVKDGVRYHHLLDPKTGWPLNNDVYTVTILTARSADADALASSCYLLGAEKGMALVESLPDVEAIFLMADGSARLSSGMGTAIPFTPPENE